MSRPHNEPKPQNGPPLNKVIHTTPTIVADLRKAFEAGQFRKSDRNEPPMLLQLLELGALSHCYAHETRIGKKTVQVAFTGRFVGTLHVPKQLFEAGA